ncbi:MAG: M28 family metallopeptidase [Tannerellaceae bacterium]|nr:M28 family metallopeptidase [Tannerellaceae bacterium]
MKTIFTSIFSAILLLTASFHSEAQVIMNRDAVIAEAVSAISVSHQKALVHDLVGFHNRNNLSSQTDPNKGIGAAAEYLYRKVASYIPESEGRLSVEKVYYTVGGPQSRLGREVTLCNVIATIQGSDKTDNRVIAVLAHYDNRNGEGNDSTAYAPGANDDGSGIACLMEMARIISKIKMPVTVQLMFLSGEEHGLFGAEHMAALAKKENRNLIAVINNDMIGNSNASETNTQTNTIIRVFSENIPAVETDEMRRIRIYNSAENDSYSRQLARYVKETGERYVDNLLVKLIYRNDRFGRGGDHTPFSKQGFAAVRICEVNENYDRTHQYVREENGIKYGDEIWAIDFEYVRKNTAMNLASVVNMALAPVIPENVKLSASGLTNYSLITWDIPGKGKQPDAYYVLIRETDQPNWQIKIRVTDTQVKLPFSKDNYFFAVQSVDSQGHESLAAFAYGGR